MEPTPQTPQPVIIESPYSGDIEKNVSYAWECLNDSYFRHNEAPIATHLLWTKLSTDCIEKEHIPDDKEGRKRAMTKCRELRKKINKVIFYVDRGWSGGMKLALEECKEDSIPYEIRRIYVLRDGDDLGGNLLLINPSICMEP